MSATVFSPEVLTSIAISVGFLSGTGAVLAALLVIAERSILNYGPCTIDINNGEKSLTVPGGSSLLTSLASQDIFIPSACGGRGTCAYCKLKVIEGGGQIGPVEEPNLSTQERAENIRLSCQVKIRSNVRIEIPRHLFSVKRFEGVLEQKRMLTHDIAELRIRLKTPGLIDFTAGQYIQLESEPYKGRDAVMRAYSISSPPSLTTHVEVLIRKVPNGICTTWVHDHLVEGKPVRFSGPYGDFRLSATDTPVLFIAGGSGMAPIWSILRDMCEKGINNRPTMYFFGALTQTDLFFVNELKEIESRNPWFTFVPALSKEPPGTGWSGEQGLITDVLDRRVPDTSKHEAYLCGSPGMIDACVKVLTKNGMPVSSVFYDKFS